METVVSGIRPTGRLHLGNYFGAVKNFVKMQHEHQCFFFIADYHSLTTHPTPSDLAQNVKNILVEYSVLSHLYHILYKNSTTHHDDEWLT